jgi:hypothetical protein
VPRERFAVPRESDASRFYLPSGRDEPLRLPASGALGGGASERSAAGTSRCAGSSSDRGDDERGLTGISPTFTPLTVRSAGTGEGMTRSGCCGGRGESVSRERFVATRANDAPRFLFYSHDGLGLGRIRRNLAIARALTDAAAHASIVLATSAEYADTLGLAANVDLLRLPSLRKLSNGHNAATAAADTCGGCQ